MSSEQNESDRSEKNGMLCSVCPVDEHFVNMFAEHYVSHRAAMVSTCLCLLHQGSDIVEWLW